MKRKRSAIKKSKVAILKEADRLQKSGIDVSHRFLVVGGKRPKSVSKEREQRDLNKKTRSRD